MNRLLILLILLPAFAFSSEYYCVQLASSKDLRALKSLFKKVMYLPDLRIEKIGGMYTLRAGFFNRKENAERLLRRAKLVFPDSFVRRCLLAPDRMVVPNMRKKGRTKFFTYDVGMKLASLYIKKKDLKRAEDIYRELSDMYPDSREVKLQLARVLYWQGKYDESLRIYKELEQFDPKIADERRKVEIKKVMDMVEKLESEGKLDEAIKLLEKLYEEEKSYTVGIKLGRLYMISGNRQRAHEVFSELRKKYPEDRDILHLYTITKASENRRSKKKLLRGFSQSLRVLG